ncbi:MAG: hypothetical protein AB7S99_04805 [Pseudodonghicola sp.]
MAGSKNSSVGRAAALAAANRVRLLLTVVEDDDFLTEVLHSADRAMDGLRGPTADSDRRGDDKTRRNRASWTGRGRPAGRG